MFDWYLFLASELCILSTIGVGVLIWLKEKKSLLNRYFLYLCASLVVYVFSTYLSFLTFELIFIRLSLVGATLFLLQSFLFVKKFTSSEALLSDKYVILIAAGIAALCVSPYVFSDVIENDGVTLPTPQFGIIFFGAYCILLISLSIFLLVKEIIRSDALRARQATSILVGLSITLLSGFLFLFVAVNIFQTTKYIPLALFGSLAFVVLSGYSITRYRFFDVNIVLKKTLIYSGVNFLILFVSVIGSFIFSYFFYQRYPSPTLFFSSAIAATLFIATAQFAVNKALHSFLLKGQVALSVKISEAKHSLSTTHELETFILKLSAMIQELLEAPVVLCLVRQEHEKKFVNYFPGDIALKVKYENFSPLQSLELRGSFLQHELQHLRNVGFLGTLMRRVGAKLIIIVGREERPDLILFVGARKGDRQFDIEKLASAWEIARIAEGALPNIFYWQKTVISLKRMTTK
jgi:hypothetical protein